MSSPVSSPFGSGINSPRYGFTDLGMFLIFSRIHSSLLEGEEEAETWVIHILYTDIMSKPSKRVVTWSIMAKKRWPVRLSSCLWLLLSCLCFSPKPLEAQDLWNS